MDDPLLIHDFDECIRKHYKEALERAYNFFEQPNSKMGQNSSRTIAALIELIRLDETIPDDAEFYIKDSGRPMTKTQLLEAVKFNYQAFMLGIWHYIIVNIHDNTVINLKPSGDDFFAQYE